MITIDSLDDAQSANSASLHTDEDSRGSGSPQTIAQAPLHLLWLRVAAAPDIRRGLFFVQDAAGRGCVAAGKAMAGSPTRQNV
ncbi:hypothetical protein ACPA2N_19065 [Ectopseudomonas hydrolytica]|uniref:hypothetical protein n=1 Tax=Ectopseudomonas hydrolytica TaxID=2493633 RepID=UPI003C3062F5